mmetsp:Transcript_9704/g.19628  ORF Transcript_9704/g.19628 Transcript_9704/m.19628 type:complete len:261 (-) Transcript_9704:249-1031(-)|eukprot:CAMPEP_0119069438 /NCGR_PEP_ID=MMETSP1178-20130426/19560_1 /TAXON_ID=33656 /ORGANISM="unid sp, Strain CCMP2000" /LENGTH=260 /DNA_ID=CAMNT_0007051201 /DNA_START=61 /DNA_END=843 /DNA_ORIENTATION=+
MAGLLVLQAFTTTNAENSAQRRAPKRELCSLDCESLHREMRALHGSNCMNRESLLASSRLFDRESLRRRSKISKIGKRSLIGNISLNGIISLPAGCVRWLSQIGRREPRPQAAGAAWLGHWELDSFENDKAEQVMRADGVPFFARRMAMRFKAERRFAQHEGDGSLVGELKTVTGSWTEMSVEHATTTKARGFAAHSLSRWETDGVLCTVSTVTGPMGGTKKTTTRHYLDGDRLVCETTSPGGTYKAFFRKRALPDGVPA